MSDELERLSNIPLSEATPADLEALRRARWEQVRIQHWEQRRAAKKDARKRGVEVAFITPDELPAEPPAGWEQPASVFTETTWSPPAEPKKPGFSLGNWIRETIKHRSENDRLRESEVEDDFYDAPALTDEQQRAAGRIA